MIDDPKLVAVAGDWHGNSAWARHAVEYAHLKGADVVLHVGDFGYWPDEGTERGVAYLKMLQAKLEEFDMRLYWLDGNHENHDHLAEVTQGEHGEFPLGKYDRIIYLSRGYRWDWWGKTFMAVGGAVSVDKQYRTEGRDWWPAEILTDEQVAYASREGHVDIVLAHDCAHGVDIPGIGPATKQRPGETQWPYLILLEAEAHRLKMRQIWEATQPKIWIHGHYHREYEFWLRDTKFLGLDCDGTKMTKNMTFLTKEDL